MLWNDFKKRTGYHIVTRCHVIDVMWEEREKKWLFDRENQSLWLVLAQVQLPGGWRTSLSLNTRKLTAFLEELRDVPAFVLYNSTV